MKIPKDKQNEKGEYSLKDDEGLQGSPKKSAPKDYQITQKERVEHEAFINKLKNKSKKSPNIKKSYDR